MSHPRPALLTAAAVIASLVATVPAVAAPDAAPTTRSADGAAVAQEATEPELVLGAAKGTERYVVQLSTPAVPTRAEGLPRGRRAPSASSHRARLRTEQSTLRTRLRKVVGGTPKVRRTFTEALNGMVVELTAKQAKAVATLEGVRSVVVDDVMTIDTDRGPASIGAGGVWDGTATPEAVGTRGEGVLVGIIDSGVNPDNPSLGASVPVSEGGDGYVHTNPFGAGSYKGMCDPSSEQYEPAFTCNDKLVGAWKYTDTGPSDTDPSIFDNHGHGSHVASTAAGNQVRVTDPSTGTPRRISGVAPHANIISYDVCYSYGTGTRCAATASAAAVEQAILDGVDVLNHSIGSTASSSSWNPVQGVAFRNARAAGIDVANSAGNAGPDAATTGGPGDLPWLTSVAATEGAPSEVRGRLTGLTSDAAGLADLNGVGDTTFPDGLPGQHPLVNASAVGDNLCKETHPEWAGKIVVCDRGDNARVDKSWNVERSGGVGMVLVNASALETLVIDPHHVPTVHIDFGSGVSLQNLMGRPHPRGGIAPPVDNGRYEIAGFSSRGENRLTSTITPSLAAPGVDVLAADGTNGAVQWGRMSGTSMASPHVAGSFALLAALHPEWSPAESQSALMTTARQNVYGNGTASYPFTRGSGRVDLTRAVRAGLLLDESDAAYVAADPALGGDARTLNLASMADNTCVDTCSWTRRFTGTDLGAGTWTVTTETDSPGLVLDAPSTLTVTAGGTTSLTVDASYAGVPAGTWLFGTLVLTPPSGSEAVTARLPIAVKPTNVSAPREVVQSTGRDASGVEVPLRVLDAHAATVTAAGLVRDTGTTEAIAQDPSPTLPDDTEVGRVRRTVTVPPGTSRLVAEVAESTAPDLDLYVLDPQGGTACTSANADSVEKCSLVSPATGTWTVLVNNYQGSDAELDSFVLRTTVVGDDGDSLAVQATPGADGHALDTVVTWDEPRMEPGDTWYGALRLTTAEGTTVIPLDVRRADDDVTRTASASTSEIGDVITHTVTVTPVADRRPVTWTVTETLPDGVELVGPPPAGVTAEGDTLVWEPTVPAHSTTPLILTYETRVTSDVADGQVLTHTTTHRTSQPGSRAVDLSSSVTLSAPPVPTARPLTSSGPGVRSVTVPRAPGESVQLEEAGAPVSRVSVTGGTYTADAATGVLSFTPAARFHGVAPAATYRLVDRYGRFTSAAFTPTVWATAPTATDRTSSGTGTQRVTVPLEAWQGLALVDGGRTVQSLRVAAGTYGVAGGTITFTPTSGFTGAATPVRFRVTDTYGQTAEGTWTPTVTGAPATVKPTPTASPTPTKKPSATPTTRPSGAATVSPTAKPTGTPSAKPTGTPTAAPSTTTSPAPRPVGGTLVVTRKKGVVKASQHRPKAKKPSRITARCVPESGTVADCAVTLTTTVKGTKVRIGSGTVSGAKAGGGTVVVKLTKRGRALAARPQGVRTKAEMTLRTTSGVSAAATTTFTVAASRAKLARTVRFAAGGVKVSRTDARWLRSTGKKAVGVRKVVCVGFDDNVGASREALARGRARAAAACSALKVGKGVEVVVKTRGDRSPVASNRTQRGRAKNRRVEITFVR